MRQDTYKITNYTTADGSELLRLLLLLQVGYFNENASREIQEVRRDKDPDKAYKDYVEMINQGTDDTWKVFLAKNDTGQAIGFIIGSIEIDDGLELGKIGKLEDWYVEDISRGQGIGIALYNKLEQWFKEKGCQQVVSDTWEGNESSIKAHKRSGFFVSSIHFSKKLG